MATILAQAISAIVDNYSDVIEGGNSYNSGSTYTGVSGTQSNNAFAEDALTVEAGSTTTSIAVANSYGTNRFVKVAAPPWFLVGSSGTTGNVGAARKISANSATTFTVAAFPATPAAADVLVLREGFKRAPDNWDVEDDNAGTQGSHDRTFQLSLLPGRRLPWYGNTIETYETILNLRLRILKHSRSRKAIASAMENLLFLRTFLTWPDNRDGTYTQLVEAESQEPEIVADDNHKIVVLDRYRLVFRVGADIL